MTLLIKVCGNVKDWKCKLLMNSTSPATVNLGNSSYTTQIHCGVLINVSIKNN